MFNELGLEACCIISLHSLFNHQEVYRESWLIQMQTTHCLAQHWRCLWTEEKNIERHEFRNRQLWENVNWGFSTFSLHGNIQVFSNDLNDWGFFQVEACLSRIHKSHILNGWLNKKENKFHLKVVIDLMRKGMKSKINLNLDHHLNSCWFFRYAGNSPSQKYFSNFPPPLPTYHQACLMLSPLFTMCVWGNRFKSLFLLLGVSPKKQQAIVEALRRSSLNLNFSTLCKCDYSF